jgi:hypothetical protein
MDAEATRSEEDLTREEDLADWQTFCFAYYEPICRVLRLRRVPEEEVDDQSHAFLLKVADCDFLRIYRDYRDRKGHSGLRNRFRPSLYRSLQNHIIDTYRERRPRPLGSDQLDLLQSWGDPALEPDALYALDVLH